MMIMISAIFFTAAALLAIDVIIGSVAEAMPDLRRIFARPQVPRHTRQRATAVRPQVRPTTTPAPRPQAALV